MIEVARDAFPSFPGTALSQGPCAHINSDAIASNLTLLRQRLSRTSNGAPRLWAVLKADAYGHTLAAALPGMSAADGIAVSSLSDAYACRLLGWHKPVLLMGGGFRHEDLLDPALHPLHLVIDDWQQLSELSRLDGRAQPSLWLRSRGSLGHAGFGASEYHRAHGRLQALAGAGKAGAVGHFLHFAQAEDRVALQEERSAFQRLVAGLPGPRCMDNSAALLSSPSMNSGDDWVRSGIALYGASPLPNANGPTLGLKAAMRLTAPLYGIHPLRAGEPVGYGGNFRAASDMRIGLLRCGYADGYPRGIERHCYVGLGGTRAAILGRVSMDTLTIDVSHLPAAHIGTHFDLWGTSDLPVETVASSAGTIAAQLLTGLTNRVPRVAVPRTEGATGPA